MSEADKDESEVSAETPIGKFRARGHDTITFLLLVGMATFGTLLYVHMEDTKKSNMESVKAQREVASSVKLSACILATDQEKRADQYMQPNSFCNRMAQ